MNGHHFKYICLWCVNTYIDEKPCICTMIVKHHQTYVSLMWMQLLKNILVGEPWKLVGWCWIHSATFISCWSCGGGHLNTLFSGNWWLQNKQLPSAELARIDATFGSFEDFKSSLLAAATAEAYVLVLAGQLVVSKEGKLEVTSAANQDTPISEENAPILVWMFGNMPTTWIP